MLFLKKENTSWRLAQLEHFSSELSQLLNAGLPLFPALTLLTEHLTLSNEKALAKILQQKIARGVAFSVAWEQATKETLSTTLLKAGETSGLLLEMLKNIRDYAHNQNKLRQLIWQAVRYPVFLFIMTCGLLGLLCNWVVPQFATLYTNFNVNMPSLTQHILHSCLFVQDNMMPLIAGFISLVLAASLMKKNKFVKKILGAIKHQFSLYRNLQELYFWHAISLLLKSGIPLIQALEICQPILEDEPIKVHISHLIRNLHHGTKPSTILKQFNCFSPKLISIFALGEATGQLTDLLNSYVQHQQESIQLEMQSLKTWLEPVFLCFIGLIIGVVLIALYLPIIELGKWI